VTGTVHGKIDCCFGKGIWGPISYFKSQNFVPMNKYIEVRQLGDSVLRTERLKYK
jgi:hypothetical protein